MTRILFFGRVGERLGPEGSLDLPPGGLTIREIRRLLSERDEVAAEALLRPDVRASVDLVVVSEDARVRPDQEIAFFSIFSGG
ncbi:MAG: MoaD/ThiS family protein [Brevundimonas sp.]|uniref:MoaD/ThiS family protein n=1 Tax=Brevundimonas sp. TaxID=1871086 RepID=UPI002721CCF7|nr:MoaD/ThiS family protein [Brevundimonas sp.]MDO9586684.1 MoaD/ThiS family protein [Brevundimonas sp.]MDP3368237.1 MoaD/ThiS family protein [Brevundimonas sp.]MDZ4111957.1 MoaD/ThiS family protein [Brevundimonas sp.]MDZ4317276.1 MoaD/ThiS family protein [Phenylobacterium sp.]